MYECVANDVEYVLAGSIRDDGPLPDVLMDLPLPATVSDAKTVWRIE